jgi:PhoH-like ATPase
MKKTFVLDTNVLLYDAECLLSFDDNNIVIPLIVLEELDAHKRRPDEAGKNARRSVRTLDKLRELGSINEGIDLESGGTLRILSSTDIKCTFPPDIDMSTVDNQILAMSKCLQESSEEKVILVTKDINVRVKCDALGIKCEDFNKHRIVDKQEGLYSGVKRANISQAVIDKIYSQGYADLEDIPAKDVYPNEFLVLKDETTGQGSAIVRYMGKEEKFRLIPEIKSSWGLVPRNKEQKFSLDILFDDNIKLITLVGKAGTGKTLLAASAALEQSLSSNAKYKKVVISRPVQSVGKDIGYLPGDIYDKMAPWIAPIRDNLRYLFGDDKDTLDMYIESGKIEIEAITYIRGRSISDAIIIIDEAQNLTTHELKTIVTRVGENTKIILTGDVDQIDNTYLDSVSNGLSYTVEKFKEYDISAHITLIKGERSALASLGSEIL